jgi:DHA1 family bicyclomycin/chloramphenicol resistance-like MFS transporter
MTQASAQLVAGRRLTIVTILLSGFTALGPLTIDLYLPAFPHLATDLSASQATVQLTLTADVIGLVVGQLVLGPL